MATAIRGRKLAGKSRTDKRPPIELNLPLQIENAVRDSSRMPTAALASGVVNITQIYILKVGASFLSVKLYRDNPSNLLRFERGRR
jgi:hypothetical protein